MNKSYVAFQRSEEEIKGLTQTAWLATGTGTEVGADPCLALVIQLMASTLAGRDMVLFTFGDTELKDELYREGKEAALTYFSSKFL